MTESSGRTRLSSTEARADQLAHRLQWFSRARPLTLSDAYAVAGPAWTRAQTEAAIDTLVARGDLEESAHGHLIVRDREAA